MGITPPFIAPIKLPKTPKTARISAIPAAATQAPADSTLITQLEALALPETPAILAAYKAFGKTTLFEARLLEALLALPLEEIDERLYIHIARLGAEAYVLDIEITGLTDAVNKAAMIGFASSTDELAGGRRPEAWTQFVMRRLFERTSIELTGDETHVQFHKAIDFLQFVQDELDREYRLIVASSYTLEEYRRVLFKIVQKHYQALFDGMFSKASGSRYKASVKQLENNLQALLVLNRVVEPPPKVNAFRIKKDKFRDYFDPKNKTDFRFFFFSESASPIPDEGPELVYRSVLEKRFRQHLLLEDLRPGPRTPSSPAFPDPPRLHDNQSWQVWTRKMWTGLLTHEEHHKRLETICGYISRYFHSLSAHEPFDLEEGSKTKSYLKRQFPRAVHGGVVHDCLVYAVRWIYFLGQMLDVRTMPSTLLDPRIWLVEMPAHVGVMIRLRLAPRTAVKDTDILIAINNQNAAVMTIEIDADEEEAADQVVGKMYEGIDTPVIITKITAKPTDAKALWRQIAKFADKKSVLPYDDPDEPWLRYLQFTAESSKVVQRLKYMIVRLYQKMREGLERAPAGKKRAAYEKALDRFNSDIAPAFAIAQHETEHAVKPLADEINGKVAEHKKQIEKIGATIARFGEITNWTEERTRYELKINEAKESLELVRIDPDVVFGRDELQVEWR